MIVPETENSASRPSDGGGAEAQRRGGAARVGHLRRDGALPDQLVERELVADELAGDLGRRAEHVAGRTHGLVGLLRVLDLLLVAARDLADVLRAVELAGLGARRGERRLRERRGVGTHIGDEAALVETLRDAHRALRGPAELAARLLLQRRGHERRGGRALYGLSSSERTANGCALERRGERRRRRLVEVHEVVRLQRGEAVEVTALRDAGAVDGDEPRVEGARTRTTPWMSQ